MASLTVRPAAAADASAYAAFVASREEATLFHEPLWREVLESVFGHRIITLLALQDDAIVGALPLTEIRSKLFGHSLISMPFGVYGGILARDEAATRALVDGATALREDRGAEYVELRHRVRPPGGAALQLPGSELYATFGAPLPEEEEAVIANIPRKARAEVRKALKDELLEVDTEGRDLEAFFRLFSQNKRSLGSPPFPRKLFTTIAEALGPQGWHLLTVRRDGEPKSMVMSFIHRGSIMAYYSGATDDANRYRANNVMYAALQQWGIREGHRFFDFGRSRVETGAFAFKKNQGFEPVPLAYEYLLPEGGEKPSVNAGNPRYELARKAFRGLPAGIAERLGAYVTRRAPV